MFAAEGHAFTEIIVVAGAGGVHTVAGCQHPVEGGRRTTTLNVAQCGGTHVVAEAFLNFVANDLANTIKHLVAELVDGAFGEVHGAGLGQCTFGNNDNAVFFAQLESSLHCLGYFGNIEGGFGDNDVVGAASHAGVQGDPPHVSAHDLHNHHPVVGFRGGV